MPAGLASENSLGNLELPGTPDTLTLQGYRYCGVDQILVWPVAPTPGVQAGGAGAGCGVQAAQRGGAGGERQPGEQRGGERGVGGGQEAQAVPPPLGGKVHLPHKTKTYLELKQKYGFSQKPRLNQRQSSHNAVV